jgi:proteasome accessory factor B
MDAYTGSRSAVRRKFERDKRALLELGVVLDYDAGANAYSLSAESLRARPLRIPHADAVILREAVAAVAQDSGSPLAPDARGALVRLVGVADPAHSGLVVHRSTMGGPTLSDALEKLFLAVGRRYAVLFTYRYVAGGPAHEREVLPWGMFARRGHWYLTGFCTDREAPRCFRVALVENVRVPALPDGAPQFDRPDGFDIRAAAKVAPWDWELEAPVELVLEVDGDFAPLVARALGHARLDGSRVVREVSNAEAALEFAWSWLPHVRVVAPGSLALRFRSRMARVRAAHGNSA